MKYVTFDTSWLEAMQYDFSFAAFRCIQYTDNQVLISEVVDNEIQKHILTKTEGFVKTHNNSFQSAKFLLNVFKKPNDLDLNKYKLVALKSYDIFKNIIRAQIVPSKLCDIDLILKDYFSGTGVFLNKAKKNEFPDAIAINSIINFINGTEIIVFTRDDDWKNGFCQIANSKLYEKRADLLNIIKIDDFAGEVINDFLDNIIVDFTSHISNSFEKFFSNEQIMYPDNCCIDDLIVDDYDCEILNYEDVDFLSKDDSAMKITCAVHFKYQFSMDVSFDDTSICSYDREDNIKYNVIRKYQTISGKEIGYCFIDFEFIDKTYSKISSFKLSDVDFCFKGASKYNVDEKPVEEDDYHNAKY